MYAPIYASIVKFVVRPLYQWQWLHILPTRQGRATRLLGLYSLAPMDLATLRISPMIPEAVLAGSDSGPCAEHNYNKNLKLGLQFDGTRELRAYGGLGRV